MNRSGLTHIHRIGIGTVIGGAGITCMSYGSALSNASLMRTGVVLTTIGGWIITWK